MAIAYDGSADYSIKGSNLSLSASGWTFSFMFRTTDATSTILSLGVFDGTEYIQMLLNSGAANRMEWMFAGAVGATQVSNINTTWIDGSWHRHVVTWDGNTGTSSMAWYIDGVSKSLSYVTSTGTGTITADYPMTLGARNNQGTPDLHTDCDFADFAIYDGVQLSAADAAELTTHSCLAVRPADLTAFSHLFNSDAASQDIIDGDSWTHSSSPPNTDHPPLIYPSRRQLILPPAAAASFVPYPNPRYALTGGHQPLGGGIA